MIVVLSNTEKYATLHSKDCTWPDIVMILRMEDAERHPVRRLKIAQVAVRVKLTRLQRIFSYEMSQVRHLAEISGLNNEQQPSSNSYLCD